MQATVLANRAATPATTSALGGLYQHHSRPQWGLATRVAKGDGKTSFQFLDGKLRKIGDSHVHLMSEVDRPSDESEQLQRQLAAMAGLSLARRGLRKAGQEVITIDQQIQLFLSEYEGGFDGPGYAKQHRGVGQRRAKRHRDAAVAHATELLGRKELLQLIASSRHHVVIERVLEVLTATSLVNKRHLQPLHALDERGVRRAANALCELLYGDVHEATAMQAWIDALSSAGKGVSWPLATAVSALVQPSTHICVLHSVLAIQARWMAPSLRMSKVPNGRLYVRLREMAVRLVEELEARDLVVRDLLDVCDFVWLTLRPAARKHMAVMLCTPVERHSATSSNSAASSSTAASDDPTVETSADTPTETLAA